MQTITAQLHVKIHIWTEPSFSRWSRKERATQFILMQQRVVIVFPSHLRLLDDTDRCLKAFRAERTVRKIAAKGLTNGDLYVHKGLISCAKWTKRRKEKRKNH